MFHFLNYFPKFIELLRKFQEIFREILTNNDNLWKNSTGSVWNTEWKDENREIYWNEWIL